MCKRMRPDVWIYRAGDESGLWGIFCAYRDPENPKCMVEKVIDDNGVMVAWNGRAYPKNGMLSFLSDFSLGCLLTILKHGRD